MNIVMFETHHLIAGLLFTAFWCFLAYISVKHIFNILDNIEDYLVSHSGLSIYGWLAETLIVLFFAILLVVIFIVALCKV